MDNSNFKRLSKDEYRVLRERGTEPAFSGSLLKNKETGTYHCKACGNLLFKSDVKFDSETGWPSFSDVIKGSVKLNPDSSHGLDRIEVKCSKCGSHLGHVFGDGPKPTGKRYCINSIALDFKKDEKNEDEKHEK
jgi:peptide-methionine (R)-S-oxide reductase